jgi:hypothetical protein
MRRSILALAALAAFATAACGGDPTSTARTPPRAPRATVSGPLAIEITAPATAGRDEACWYYAHPYGGTGTYYIYWDGVDGYHYANDTQVLGWIGDVGWHYVSATVYDGSGASATAGAWVNGKLANVGC